MLLTIRSLIVGSVLVVCGFLLNLLIEPNLVSVSDKVQVALGTAGLVGWGVGWLLLSMWVWKLEKETQQLKRQLQQASGARQ